MTERSLTSDQRLTIIYGILAFIAVLVILQLWLLTATLNSVLGGDLSPIWPATATSAVCFLMNLGLLIFVLRLERR